MFATDVGSVASALAQAFERNAEATRNEVDNSRRDWCNKEIGGSTLEVIGEFPAEHTAGAMGKASHNRERQGRIVLCIVATTTMVKHPPPTTVMKHHESPPIISHS